MSKSITYVLAVTDMSGSMIGLVEDVRGGFNTYLKDLKLAAEEKGLKFRLSLTLFDTEFTSLCTGAKLKDVPELTTENYYARGATALLDAVGKTVLEFEKKVKLRKKDKVILYIQTDGQGNSSLEFSWDNIREMLEKRKETGQWAIMYVGQGIQSWAQGKLFGPGTQVIAGAATKSGTQSSYTGRTMSTIAYAAGASPDEAGDILSAAV